jgi:UDP-galactopyranose mutase
VREFPTDEGDPYYPIPAAENEALFKQYQAMAEVEATRGVLFVGRLAQYRYYNMDQVVAAALHACEELVAELASGQDLGQAAEQAAVRHEEIAA